MGVGRIAVFLTGLTTMIGAGSWAAVADETTQVSGKVLRVDGAQLTIDVGASGGLTTDTDGVVWYELVLPNASPRRINVARIRIISVQPERAQASILKSTGPVQAGYHVSFMVSRSTASEAPLSLPERSDRPRPFVAPPAVSPAPPARPFVEKQPLGAGPPALTAPPREEASPAVATPGAPCVGQLFVKTEPPQAALEIDGRPVEGGTPALVDRLTCGAHRVVVNASRHTHDEREVNIEGGRTAQLTIALATKQAELRMMVVPDAATVFLDGRPVGVSPIARRPWPGAITRFGSRSLGSSHWNVLSPSSVRTSSTLSR